MERSFRNVVLTLFPLLAGCLPPQGGKIEKRKHPHAALHSDSDAHKKDPCDKDHALSLSKQTTLHGDDDEMPVSPHPSSSPSATPSSSPVATPDEDDCDKDTAHTTP